MQTLPLTHGFFSANDYGVGIVDDSVADGISQQRVRQLLRPARNVKLGTEDRGVSLVPGLHDFQQNPGLRFFQRVQKPFINNEQSMRVCQNIQPGNVVIFFLCNRECSHREVKRGNSLQNNANSWKFVLWNKCRCNLRITSIFIGFPGCCATTFPS